MHQLEYYTYLWFYPHNANKNLFNIFLAIRDFLFELMFLLHVLLLQSQGGLGTDGGLPLFVKAAEGRYLSTRQGVIEYCKNMSWNQFE